MDIPKGCPLIGMLTCFKMASEFFAKEVYDDIWHVHADHT